MGNFISYECLPVILNMSLTAGVVILFVLLMRLLLRKAPKILSYALWLVVLFRLLCPVSLTAEFSLLQVVDPPLEAVTDHTSAVSYVPRDVVHNPTPAVELPLPGVGEAITGALPQEEEQTVADPLEAPMAIATIVWLMGVAALAGYGVVSLIRLRRRLVGAVPLEKQVYLADHIDTPFVLGLVRAKIYLPSALPERERGYILLHERHHIRRLDHVVKLVAFLALCIHWFNPLVWLAFTLLGKDMEMSCDEAVMKKLGEDVRADYSASLLSLSTGRRIIAGAPLAFGEGDPRDRVKNVLAWRRPRLWAVLAGGAACAAVIAACAINPTGHPDNDRTGQYASMEDYAQARVQEILDGNSITYAIAGEDGAYTRQTVTDTVEDARGKVTFLGSLEGMAPEGRLEAWEFSWEVKPTNAQNHEIFIAGGGGVTEDGFCNFDQTDLLVVLCRSDNGRYEILWKKTAPEHTDFYGYHNSCEEALYDWYVAEYGLDLPLYVEDWIDRVEVPEGGSLGNFPVHRFDGDGWYLYIPVSAWGRAVTEDPENQWQWVSGYGTGSTLMVERLDTALTDQQSALENQGFVPVDGEGQAWRYPDGNIRVRLYETDGGCLRVTTDYDSGRITDYPYIAMEPQTLELMAESFALDDRIGADVKPRLTLEDVQNLAGRKGEELSWADFEAYDCIETGSGLYIRIYPIDETFSLSIGGAGPEEEPLYIYLTTEEDRIDICRENVRAFIHRAQAIRDGAELLSDQEVAWFNEYLEPIVLDEQENPIGVNPVSCFLTSYYDDVTQLDFEEFMRYFPGDGSKTGETEFQALRKVENWPFSEVESLDDMPVPVHKYPRRQVDLILKEYAGITTENLDTSAVAYLSEYDAYYNYTSDFGPGMFPCTWGYREGDLLWLYNEESPSGTDVLTLRKVGDKTYHVVSHQSMGEE